jgi:hypothetical protein
MNVDVIDKKCPILDNGSKQASHPQFHADYLILDMDIRLWHTQMSTKFEQNRTRIDNFRKMTLTYLHDSESPW